MDTQINIQAEHLNSPAILSLYSHVINNQTSDTINAKDLHSFLEIGRHFAAWLKARIQQYQFVENEDFILIPSNGVIKNRFNPERGRTSNLGGRPTKDYFITLDMAKELAMVERNDKGREARRYFIECERELKAAGKVSPAIEDSSHEVSVNEPHLPVITLETLTASILALANKRSERNVPVESHMITEAVMKYLGLYQLSDANAAQLEKGLSFIQTAIEGEYQGRTTHQTDEYIASLERRLESYERRMKLIHSHTRVMKRDFQSIISPTLKETNSGLYGNAREHLHVAHMYSTVY